MKERTNKMSILFFVILASQMFLPKSLNLVIVISVFAFLLLKNNFLIEIDFPGVTIYFIFLSLGMLIGIVGVTKNGHSSYSFFKHLYYFIMPILYWSIGSLISVRERDINKIQRSIILVTTIYTIYDLINSFVIVLSANYNGLHQLRELIGAGSIYPILTIYFLLFYDNNEMEKKYVRIILIISILSVAIHFSRTYLLELIIFVVFSGALKKQSKLLKIIMISIIGIAVLYSMFPVYFNNFIEKILYSATELKIEGTNWDYVSINNNWRGYELYCELKHFKEAGFLEQLFGGGFGQTLDVYDYAYLVTNEDRLIFLHNGYGTVLMIWGVVGVILYLAWGVKLYKCSNNICDKNGRNFLKGLSVVIMVVSYFIMGPFFSEGVAIYLFIFSLVYNNGKRIMDGGDADENSGSCCNL